MIGTNFRIINAKVVTPTAVLDDSEITVENGKISSVGPSRNVYHAFTTIDAGGRILLPGFIDMHSDAIEKEIEPRPGSLLPINVAVSELDRKLAASGITTIYHSLSFSDIKLEMMRTSEMVDSIIHEIRDISTNLLINTSIHARFEITCSKMFPVLERLVKENAIDMISIMDHTPGQGQFTSIDQFRNYYGTRFSSDINNLDRLASYLQSISNSTRLENSEATAKLCRENNIPLASHDDDTIEKIEFIHECGAVITEFPITFEVCDAARRKALAVAVGSPNIVRGGSHNGNLSAEKLISEGFGTIVCSDYIPSTMLHAAFRLYKNKTADLLQIAELFSTNAANALGLNNTGAIKEGLDADLVLVDTFLSYPRIAKTFVKGNEVYSTCLK